MICVTGAGGTVGSEVVNQLTAAEASFRTTHSSEAKVGAARDRGSDAVAQQTRQPFSNAVGQRAEMIRELKEIKTLLKEQNLLLTLA